MEEIYEKFQEYSNSLNKVNKDDYSDSIYLNGREIQKEKSNESRLTWESRSMNKENLVPPNLLLFSGPDEK